MVVWKELGTLRWSGTKGTFLKTPIVAWKELGTLRWNGTKGTFLKTPMCLGKSLLPYVELLRRKLNDFLNKRRKPSAQERLRVEQRSHLHIQSEPTQGSAD
ncbi:hypothetical protein AVEN_142402-1 [Araneus ventricosus]|uniref:Uncharacterized protein n=1 Tax=Araneus ventricosus TaxID=182803 RepID=A0A4Y2FGI4_ARAVE|nr:hypothetical protein AVEN_142402-1 [Araneus ventricosus]